MPLKPRDLIIDNLGREGIVIEQAKRPAAGWLAEQRDCQMRELPEDTVWWKVMPICGGAVLVPEPLAKFVREAAIEDAMRAVEHCNDHALLPIAQLFPDVVAFALQRRKNGTAA